VGLLVLLVAIDLRFYVRHAWESFRSWRVVTRPEVGEW
jgi:hypothetical protein